MNATDLYAVVGHPVEHSRSPFIHARFATLTGQPLRYERRLAPLDGFAATLAAFAAEGGRGCNVTVPFKQQAFALASRASARAALAGAANVLTRAGDGWAADNSDGIGLVRDLREHAGVAIAGRRVLVVGAGGAAAGVLGPLIDERPAALVVANRTLAHAEALVASHADLARARGVVLRAAALADAGRGHDLVVNATSSSLAGAPVPVAAEVLASGALAVDLMYGPAARPFLDWAATHGARARDGLGMLVEQAAESFFLWRGVRPPTAAVLTELRARLDAGLP